MRENPFGLIRQKRIMQGSPMFGGSGTNVNLGRTPGIGPGQGGFRGLDISRPQPMDETPRPNIGIGQGGWGNLDLSANMADDEPVAPVVEDNASQFYKEMQRLQAERGPAVTAYQNAIAEQPSAADYRPNWLTRIAAGLSGFSAGMKDPAEGVRTAMAINNSGYDRAMTEYQQRVSGLKESAGLERDDLKLRLSGLEAAQKAGLDYKKYQLDQQNVQSEIANREKNTKIAEGNMQANQQRAAASARADYTYTPVQGGFMAQNKNDPNDHQLIPARTIQEAQLQVAQGQLKVSQGQLGVSQGNLAVNQANSEGNLENTASIIANRENGGGKFVPAGEQASAAKMVDDELSMDPAYSKFYGKRGVMKGGFYAQDPVGPDDFKDQPGVWQAFLDERAARIRAASRVRR